MGSCCSNEDEAKNELKSPIKAKGPKGALYPQNLDSSEGED